MAAELEFTIEEETYLLCCAPGSGPGYRTDLIGLINAELTVSNGEITNRVIERTTKWFMNNLLGGSRNDRTEICKGDKVWEWLECPSERMREVLPKILKGRDSEFSGGNPFLGAYKRELPKIYEMNSPNGYAVLWCLYRNRGKRFVRRYDGSWFFRKKTPL